MPECPQCKQTVNAQAITCPHCRNPLKAYGHKGILLHRTDDGDYLCKTCLYHEDDTCDLPQRPYVKECTLYRNALTPVVEEDEYEVSFNYKVRMWAKRNSTLLLFLGLILVSLAIVLS